MYWLFFQVYPKYPILSVFPWRAYFNSCLPVWFITIFRWKKLLHIYIPVLWKTFKDRRSKNIRTQAISLSRRPQCDPKATLNSWFEYANLTSATWPPWPDWVYLAAPRLGPSPTPELPSNCEPKWCGIRRRRRWCRCGFSASRHSVPKSIIITAGTRTVSGCNVCTLSTYRACCCCAATLAAEWNHKLQLASASTHWPRLEPLLQHLIDDER